MSNTDGLLSRRNFIAGCSALSLGGLVMPGMGAQTSQPAGPQIPSPDTALKFSRDGRTLPFAGNTIICHLPQESPLRDAVGDLRESLRINPSAAKLALLPVHSYHMTVFSGANDQGRTANSWPSGLPMDAPIAECSRYIEGRLESFHANIALPIRVKVRLEDTVRYDVACSLRISPADDAENTKIRQLRDRIAEVYQFRAKDHPTYEFHITIAYCVSPFTSEEHAAYRAVLERHIPPIVAASPIIELGQPEYCTFETMERYDIRHLLRS